MNTTDTPLKLLALCKLRLPQYQSSTAQAQHCTKAVTLLLVTEPLPSLSWEQQSYPELAILFQLMHLEQALSISL